MLVLGLSGGPSLVFESKLDVGTVMFHDAAAVLLKDGEVLSAIEEERRSRIKHTNKAPVHAVKDCLENNGLHLSDIDKIAIYFEHSTYDIMKYDLQEEYFDDYRDYINRYLQFQLNETIDKDKIFFVSHHLAHAESAYRMSGFEDALVVTLDGAGDDSAGVVLSRKGEKSELLYKIPIADSLGFFYLDVTKFLGYDLFDEYKVMGLAPYGNAAKYRRMFKKFYTLFPDGKFTLKHNHIPLLHTITKPRQKNEIFSQVHKDIAAALQETLETIVLHILSCYQKTTGQKNLCFAGGVAHNCSSNGKIVYSNMFDSVFVQPASHDAGCALGAALYVSEPKKSVALKHVYWGLDIGADKKIEKELECWSPYISYKYMNDKSKKVASLLSSGGIIGWVQGCSEFGPRALGNRSILADPRPTENKDIINLMVKKREAYRPFAPAIMLEYINEFFDCPKTKSNYSFMNYVINVKEEKRIGLGAITHIDGTARLQTVNKETNLVFWNLLNEFYKNTGVPILLNTSFNNFAEPIVDSVLDAIVCFLTTSLHYLVIGNYLITRNDISMNQLEELRISIPTHVELAQFCKYTSYNDVRTEYLVRPNYNYSYTQKISQETSLLLNTIGNKEIKLKDLFEQSDHTINQAVVWEDIKKLWERRLVILRP
ncbi:carbamoyltransferase C-terminal domain-containing protein [Clostridium sp. E02]|uniref:carbamoyltransferase family protein n=1 Tax=Clostridium sp. E02 TaxID=2487134 RepID=UPI000F52CA12|nr:carbamoyltransferase C-terminal domain-containing protein [Clostridium sp. E02]